MELSEREECSSEKREEQLSYSNGGFAPEWQFRNPSVGGSSSDRGRGSESQRASFNPSPWNPNLSPANLGFGEADIAAMSKCVPGSWNLPDSIHGGGGRSGGGGGGGFLPPNLSHFPADSDFIKRTARVSCFNAPNPCSASPLSVNAHAQKIDINMSETLKDASLPGSPNAEKIRAESGDADPGGGGRECAANLAEVSSSKSLLAANKRKRSSEELEVDQTKRDPQMPTETKENADTNQKSNGKQLKDDVPEAPKEDYIHVRARHGQATNSHSLAERVRREKISQRMKFLQELVPGCSKVTGKAVMLDEIINYVQSLQRQVEFLSMKLATVNPRMDFNVEALLSKDFLHSQSGSSSAIGFSPDMVNPQLQLSQQELMQTSGNLNPPNVFRRARNPQMNSIHNSWDEQLQDLMQMATFGNTNNSQHPRTQ